MSSPEPRSGERPRRQYSFGEFTLDLDRGVLRRGAEELELRPKSFQALAYLVEHHGQLVAKSTLIESLWPDTAVGDNSLAQCLFDIRRALGDDSHHLIRTVARRGYVFAAPVSAPIAQFPREPAATTAAEDLRPVPAELPARPRNTMKWYGLAAGTLALAAMAGSMSFRLTHPTRPAPPYTQITNFTDSAIAPALSPDGRMVAFYRSTSWWFTTDPIYVKMLPDGEPVEVTSDPRPKYGLAFSPDGSRIAYTVIEPMMFNTYTVSSYGGQPALLLSNAGGLTWLDQRRVLFSEVRTGVHMGIVTSTENRLEHHPLYFPPHQRAMAHFSYASPDRKWALVVEMDPTWHPCRIIPLDGSVPARQVGPSGPCTSAAWSPDGKWMYFGAEVEGRHHLWRQRFPAGRPEQITSGPTEEDGLAMSPDGRSLITSVGLHESAVWIHDDHGDRPVSSEGHVVGQSVRFSSDGKFLIYLMRHDSPASPAELWRSDLASGNSGAVLRGFAMLEYDLSDDGKEIVFSAQPPGKNSQLWLARLDGSLPPRLLASAGERAPRFGPDERLLFQFTDGKANYIGQIRKDGSSRSKLVSYPIISFRAISPDRRWAVAAVPLAEGIAVMAIPTGGGSPRRICGDCPVAWTASGKFFYVGAEYWSNQSHRTLAIPTPGGDKLPDLPASGISVPEGAKALPGARILDAWDISPGPDLSVYTYVKTTVHRNLYRVPIP